MFTALRAPRERRVGACSVSPSFHSRSLATAPHRPSIEDTTQPSVAADPARLKRTRTVFLCRTGLSDCGVPGSSLFRKPAKRRRPAPVVRKGNLFMRMYPACMNRLGVHELGVARIKNPLLRGRPKTSRREVCAFPSSKDAPEKRPPARQSNSMVIMRKSSTNSTKEVEKCGGTCSHLNFPTKSRRMPTDHSPGHSIPHGGAFNRPKKHQVCAGAELSRMNRGEKNTGLPKEELCSALMMVSSQPSSCLRWSAEEAKELGRKKRKNQELKNIQTPTSQKPKNAKSASARFRSESIFQ